MFMNWNDYHNETKRKAFHDEFRRKNALPILPDDIQYLILPYDKSENNILEMHDYIMNLHGRRYGRKKAILVTTAIMTDDCIRDDA